MSPPGRFADPGALIEAQPARQRIASGRLSLARRAIVPLLLIGAWAATGMAGMFDPLAMPPPAMLVKTWIRLWNEQALPHQIGVSLARALAGGAIGVTTGLMLGIWAGLFRLGEELVDALMQMLRTIPFLALVPLFIVWFGIGETPRLLLIALATVFPMYLNTYAGVRNVDRKVVEAARSFGLSGHRLIRQVVLPLALPSVLTGLRFALSVSVLILIAAEQINATAGIGYLLMLAQTYQQVDVVVICIAIYAVLGLGADLTVRLLERLLMPWRDGIAAR